MIVTSNLKWNAHIDKLVKKGYRLCGLMKRVLSSRKAVTILPIYKSMVRPTLEYASVIWSPQYEGQKHKLESVQIRCMKMIRDNDQSFSSLEERRATIDLVNAYKLMYLKMDLDPMAFFNAAELMHNTRGHKRKLWKKRARTNIRAHFFANRVIDKWNDLPEAVVMAPNKDSFKRMLMGIRP